MRTRDVFSFIDILNNNLRENKFYRDLFGVLQEQIDKQITEPLAQLVRIRSAQHIRRGDYLNTDSGQGKVIHISRVLVEGEPFDDITLQMNHGVTITTRRRALQDRKVLVGSAELLGFSYYSDFLKDEDFARITDYISTYWPRNGQPEFIKFIGFIKNLDLNIEQLWTTDQGDDANSDDPEISKYHNLDVFSGDINPVWEGGLDYPTSHVEVGYDALVSSTIDDDLVYLFYLLAPIHLVLERLAGQINLEIRYTLKAIPDLAIVDSGFLIIE